MASKCIMLLVALAVACQAASINKREVIVDRRGFYLGGGSNNNLREASQIFDIGGPIANPWLNAWTQPLPRSGVLPAILPGSGPAGPGPAGSGPAAQSSGYAKPAAPYQAPAQQYQAPAPQYQAPVQQYQEPAPQNQEPGQQ